METVLRRESLLRPHFCRGQTIASANKHYYGTLKERRKPKTKASMFLKEMEAEDKS